MDKTAFTMESIVRSVPRLSQVYETGYLWIDQQCINQSSLAERSHQVAIMDKIYQKGNRVLIWLEGGTAKTPMLMEFLSMACEILEPLDTHSRFFGP
jgi:hypothetical protein